MHHCDTLFYECEWKGDSEECCDLLFPVFTEMGFCYAFNSRHAERTWPWYGVALLSNAGTTPGISYVLLDVAVFA